MTYQSTTTLACIRAASPCEYGWRRLLRHLGRTAAAMGAAWAAARSAQEKQLRAMLAAR